MSSSVILIVFAASFLIVTSLSQDVFAIDVAQREIAFPCDSNEECLADYANTTCQNGNCVCDSGDDSCFGTIQHTIGDKCDKDIDCNIVDAFCKDEECVCKNGFVTSYGKQKCLPLASSLNDSCQIDIQCKDTLPNSVCHKDVCMCQLFFQEVNGRCYKKSGLQKSCSSPENCWHIDNSNCSESKQCTCLDGFVESYDKKSCLKISITRDGYCEQDNQCTDYFGPNAKCMLNVCNCSGHFHMDFDLLRCIKNVAYKDACKKHEDCHELDVGENRMECVLGQCTCRRPFRLDGVECISNAGTLNSLSVISLMMLNIIYFLR